MLGLMAIFGFVVLVTFGIMYGLIAFAKYLDKL